jgi:hypothetical protein
MVCRVPARGIGSTVAEGTQKSTVHAPRPPVEGHGILFGYQGVYSRTRVEQRGGTRAAGLFCTLQVKAGDTE